MIMYNHLPYEVNLCTIILLFLLFLFFFFFIVYLDSEVQNLSDMGRSLMDVHQPES